MSRKGRKRRAENRSLTDEKWKFRKGQKRATAAGSGKPPATIGSEKVELSDLNQGDGERDSKIIPRGRATKRAKLTLITARKE